MKPKKSVAERVVERMKGLAEAAERGTLVITMRETKIEPPAPVEPKHVVAARNLLNASQAAFAFFIGSTPRAVQAWEQGHNPVPGPTRLLIELINDEPELMRNRFHKKIVPGNAGPHSGSSVHAQTITGRSSRARGAGVRKSRAKRVNPNALVSAVAGAPGTGTR